MPEKVLLTELYPYVEKTFSNKENVRALEKIISNFIDKNSDKLSTIGPTKMIMFTEKDQNMYYELTGTNAEMIRKIKNKSKDIKSDGYAMNYPFNSLMPLIIRYFVITKNTSMVRMCVSQLGMSIYPMIFYKYFRYEPNENIMNYTISNLSEKYKIKQSGNLFVAINETVDGAYKLHEKNIIRGNDSDIVQFVLAIRTRLNSFMKKIRNEFEINYRSGNYLNTEYDNSDPDDFHEANSSMYEIDNVINKTINKLLINGPSMKLIKIAANNNQVSINELRNYLTTMLVKDKTKDIQKVIESILFIFMIDGHHQAKDINTDKFLLYCLDIYKRSNTTDENVVKVKKILDSWLDELDIYKKTQRAATINNFRRALYTFFVISIQFSNIN